jgi:hypothetical protein
LRKVKRKEAGPGAQTFRDTSYFKIDIRILDEKRSAATG